MSEMEQKLLIDKQYFYQLLELINSNNEEDYSLAFQIIENMEYSNNFMYILFLFRNCISSKRELWQKVAPESYTYASSLKEKYSFNIQGMYSVLKNDTLTEEQKEFISEQFSKSLHDTLKNYGYSFLKRVTFELEW